jgi:hypothetical protein
MTLDLAQKIADAVLYEGYVLYPYRASARKNQMRWQFGVLAPPGYAREAENETFFSTTECLLEPGPMCSLQIRMRSLQLQKREVEAAAPDTDTFHAVENLEVGGDFFVAWEEAIERQVDLSLSLEEILAGERSFEFSFPGDVETEVLTDEVEVKGRLVRRTWDVSGRIRVEAEILPGPYGVVKLRADLENTTPWTAPVGERDEMLRRSVIAAHLLIATSDGAFISLLEPPEWARPAVETCVNLHTFPVLADPHGGRDVLLSSPIILYDHPQIAPESAGDMYDSTEIDEILTLRTMALTDDEKREARATDARAAGVIARADHLPPEMLDRLHGTVRYLRGVTGEEDEPETFQTPPVSEVPAAPPEGVPWWDPGSDSSVSPETDEVMINGVAVRKGSRVRLSPGLKRTDAQDMFLRGKNGRVEAVMFDVDGEKHLAVTLEDDPAADLNRSHGRFRYFSPDEVVPLGEDTV